MRLRLNTCIIGFSSLAIMLAACGDDELGGVFIPDEIPDEEVTLGPKYPVEVGTNIWYFFSTSLKRTSQSAETSDEAQSSGNLCLKVTSVTDFATTENQDVDETTVKALVKVRGGTGETSLTYSDQENPSATGSQIDTVLSPLWLKGLTVPSENHGYEEPKEVEFNTMEAPLSGGDLRWLPFIDLRRTSRKAWAGWSDLGSDEFANAGSFQQTVLNYFRDRFDNTFLGDRTKFKLPVPITPPSNCESFPDVTSCQANQCSWVSFGGTPSECVPLYSMTVIWRDQDQIDGNLQDTIHKFKVSYFSNGTLQNAQEEIAPGDIHPVTSNLPSTLPQCIDNCFTADITNKGAFNVDPSYPAPCQF